MLIDQINLNQLRVFESVYRTKSMTHAARELHLTQSGVSQHIKSLEDVLELKLFDRIKQKLVPTPAAKDLYKNTARSFEEIESVLNKLKQTDKELAGSVSIGLPIEFGNNVVIPLLAELQSKHPKIRFNIRQGFPFEMNHLLLSGDIDFALVDSFAMDKGIRIEPVYNEVLELCYAKGKMNLPKNPTAPESLEALPFIDYQEEQSILSLWVRHHTTIKHPDLNVMVYVMNAQAVAKLVAMGLGAGVLPDHLIEKMNTSGEELTIIRGSSKPLVNTISLAFLQEKTLNAASKATLEFLRSRIKENRK